MCGSRVSQAACGVTRNGFTILAAPTLAIQIFAAGAVPQQVRSRLAGLPVPIGQGDEFLAAIGAPGVAEGLRGARACVAFAWPGLRAAAGRAVAALAAVGTGAR